MNAPARAPRLNLTVWILIAALAAAAGLWLGNRYFAASQQPRMASALLYPQPRDVADFRLTQSNGKPLSLANWRGHWNIVYFGYTTCPDVCPTTLAMLKSAWAEFGKRDLQDQIRIDFISVDPQRDTPEVLGKYIAFYSTDFIAASGSDEELTKLSRGLGIVYSRTTKPDGSVEVDHSGSAVIIDPKGRMVGIFRPPTQVKDVVDDMATLVGSSR